MGSRFSGAGGKTISPETAEAIPSVTPPKITVILPLLCMHNSSRSLIKV